MTEPDPTPPPPQPAAQKPSTAIAHYDGPRNVTELAAYANLLATNGPNNARQNAALPVVFRENPSALAFAVEYARALDVPPVTAITGMHVIDGKPTASAGLISALIRRAGHKLRVWTEGQLEDLSLRAFCTIVRWDDPTFEYKVEWTIGRAETAELLRIKDGKIDARGKSGKPGGWQTYTAGMLKARAITECGRDACEDALMGIHYTPEELGAEVDGNGEVVYSVTQVQNWGAGDRPAEPEKPAEPEPVSPAMVDEIRRAILDAATVEDLKTVWQQVVKSGLFTDETWKATPMGDRDSVASTCKAVFDAELARLKAARDPDDGQGAQTPSGPENGPEDPNLGLPYEVVRLPNGEIDQVATLRNEVAWKKARQAAAGVPEPDGERPPASERAIQESAYEQALRVLANELTPKEVRAVGSWARAHDLTLTDANEHRERDAAKILEAVDRLLAWRPYDPTNYGNPAVDRRMNPDGEMEVPPAMPTAQQAASMGLDAVPVEEIKHTVEQEHAATIAAQHADVVEDRAEQARQFNPEISKDAAKAAARDAARNAELKTQPPANPVN